MTCEHKHYVDFRGGVWSNFKYVCDTLDFICWDCSKDLGTLASNCKDNHENNLIFFPKRNTLTQKGSTT